MKNFRKIVIDEPLGFSVKSATLSSFAGKALIKKETIHLKGGIVIDEPLAEG